MKLLFTVLVLALFTFIQARGHSEMSDSFLQMPVGTYLIAKKRGIPTFLWEAERSGLRIA